MIDLLTGLQNTPFATWIRESESLWALPAVISLHAFGMAALAGSSWAVDLRVLGIARGIPLEPLRLMFRVMWLGFWVNVVSGLVLFASDAAKMGASTVFKIKMLLVVLGAITTVLIERNLYDRETGAAVVNGTTKLLAIGSMVVWAAAITAGRLLAYIMG
jgi:hypothetical protein